MGADRCGPPPPGVSARTHGKQMPPGAPTFLAPSTRLRVSLALSARTPRFRALVPTTPSMHMVPSERATSALSAHSLLHHTSPSPKAPTSLTPSMPRLHSPPLGRECPRCPQNGHWCTLGGRAGRTTGSRPHEGGASGARPRGRRKGGTPECGAPRAHTKAGPRPQPGPRSLTQWISRRRCASRCCRR